MRLIRAPVRAAWWWLFGRWAAQVRDAGARTRGTADRAHQAADQAEQEQRAIDALLQTYMRGRG